MKFRDVQGREILIAQAELDIGLFGDGSDGSPNFDGTNTFAFASKSGNIYTLTRSIFCRDLTVTSSPLVTLKTAGYKIFCTGTLTNNGTITNAGNTGGTAIGSGLGSGGPAVAAGELGGSGTGAT